MKRLTLLLVLVGLTVFFTGYPVFAQNFTQNFQKTTGSNGYYRSLGSIGYPAHSEIFLWGINFYMNKNTYNSNLYPTVIKGKIWTIINVIDVPEAIKNVILATMRKGNMDTAELWEFVFPYKKIDSNGFLVVLVYGQETWGWLDCAQAFFIGLD